MIKIILATHNGKGLFVFENNDYPFVVGILEHVEVIGSASRGWSSGRYFKTLEEARTYLYK